MSMISYESALSRILSRVPKPVIQSVPLHRALGQILATPIWATQALPPFKKSFMDGYALRSKDVRGGTSSSKCRWAYNCWSLKVIFRFQETKL